ncbi:MAG: DUF1552 domain-containing protein [Planctomycetes bacterium]|nr:DUF1552 domain-containing protein [Planctomycetota bacterium]
MRRERDAASCSRRRFLRAAGVAIGLPFLPSLFSGSAWAGGDDPQPEARPPQRLMFMSVPLGFVPNKSLFDCKGFEEAGSTGWFPEDAGPLTRMPEVHASLEPYREHISFLKGLSHHRYRGDTHAGDDVFLTGADTFSDPAKALSNTISCDQVAAASDTMGGDGVRHRSLSFGNRKDWGSHSGGLSWTSSGVPVTPMSSPVQVFDLLFGKEDVPAATRLLRLQEKRSILDATRQQVEQLNRRLNAADRSKLDEVLTSVRGVEANIQREEKWVGVEKPSVTLQRPEESKTLLSSRHARTMLELAHAAFLTDSTRVISFEMPSSLVEASPINKHELNHDLTPVSARDAIKVDRAMSDEIAHFTKLLCGSQDHDGRALIQNTLVAYGAGSWGANHSMKSLPIMLIGSAGGRTRQGMTHAFPDRTPLANLWLTMLTSCGVHVDAFADSTGTLTGLG